MVRLFTILLCSLSVACSRDSEPNVETLRIQPSGPNAYVRASELVNSITYLPLQNKKDAIIGRVDKIMFAAGHIFVLDRAAAKSVFVFDQDGRLLTVLKQQGQGPGEFTSLDDILVSEQTQELAVLDASQRKILFFNFEGRFLHEMRTHVWATAMARVGPETWALFANYHPVQTTEGAKLANLIYWQRGHVVASYDTYSAMPSGFRFTPGRVFYHHQNRVLYCPPFGQTVFAIDSAGSVPYLKVDFDGKNINESALRQIAVSSNPFEALQEYAYHLGGIFENSQTRVFRLSYQGAVHHVVQSRITNHARVCRLLVQDIPGNLLVFPTAMHEDKFAAVLDVETLLAWREKWNKPAKSGLEKLVDSMTDLSNPVLAFYKFRP